MSMNPRGKMHLGHEERFGIMSGRTGRKVRGAVGLKTLATVGVLLAAILISYFIWRLVARAEDGKAAPPPPPEVAVVAMQPERVTLTTELPGRTSPYLVAEIRPQVSGIIQERMFTEGADVQSGQVLYQIDPAPFQADVDQAEANLTAAERRVDKARAALESSQARVAEQEAINELAQLNRQRYETLAQDGAVAAAERDQAVSNAGVSEAALQSAKAEVNNSREAIAEAEAAIAQARAALERARIDLEYTRITAPISGRIGISNVTVGALVNANQSQPLATIQQMDPIFVDVPQSTVDLLRLRRNLEEGHLQRDDNQHNQVSLILEDGSNYGTTGTLQFRDISVDPETGSVILRMVFPNPDGLLLPNMFVRAVVKEGVNENGLLIPQQAVSRDQKGNPLAMVVTENNVVEQRELELGKAIGDAWLVNSGLEPQDRVIVEGIQKVRPGMEVTTIPAQSSADGDETIAKSEQPASSSKH